MSRTGRTEEGRGRLGRTLSGLAVALGCVLFLGGFVWGAFVYRPYTVPTDSMTPTIKAGDRVLAQRVDTADITRGDVVVFKQKSWGNMPIVKRVVAVGGDTIACCTEGRLTVNGKRIQESYLGKDQPAELKTIPTITVPRGGCSSSATSAAVPWTPRHTSRRPSAARCPAVRWTPAWTRWCGR